MSDIVERLRELSRWLIRNDMDMRMPKDMIDPEVAADEITRLRAALEVGEEALDRAADFLFDYANVLSREPVEAHAAEMARDRCRAALGDTP